MTPWEWLDTQNVMTLATVGPDGPWAAAVYFARDGRRLVFLSSARSRHAANIAADARCAAAVNGDAPDWPSIRGVQIAGLARRLDTEAAALARTAWFARFSVMMETADPSIREALQRVDWFELVPDRMLFIDNSKGLGHREPVL